MRLDAGKTRIDTDLFILLTVVINAFYYVPGIVLGAGIIVVNKIDNP